MAKCSLELMLGVRARDKVTKYSGIVVGKAQYLYGCTQYCLAAEAGKGNRIDRGEWFDEGRLEVVGRGIQPEMVQAEKPGGPNRDCPW